MHLIAVWEDNVFKYMISITVNEYFICTLFFYITEYLEINIL